MTIINVGFDRLKGVLPQVFASRVGSLSRVSQSTALIIANHDQTLPAVVPEPIDYRKVEEEYFEAIKHSLGC